MSALNAYAAGMTSTRRSAKATKQLAEDIRHSAKRHMDRRPVQATWLRPRHA
jgi:hypothetical protein